MHPEDVVNGWTQRRTIIRAKKPSDHAVHVNGDRHDLPTLVCDDCGAEIKDGQQAVAQTMWLVKDGEPLRWEEEYAS